MHSVDWLDCITKFSTSPEGTYEYVVLLLTIYQRGIRYPHSQTRDKKPIMGGRYRVPVFDNSNTDITTRVSKPIYCATPHPLLTTIENNAPVMSPPPPLTDQIHAINQF